MFYRVKKYLPLVVCIGVNLFLAWYAFYLLFCYPDGFYAGLAVLCYWCYGLWFHSDVLPLLKRFVEKHFFDK